MTRWVETIPIGDVIDDELMVPVVARDVIVARLRDSAWYERRPELEEMVQNLELQDDFDGINYEMGGIYDLADQDKIWLDGFARFHGPRLIDAWTQVTA